MTITTMPSDELFRVSTAGIPSRVDRDGGEAGVIYGAKAMQFGPLRDGDARPWKVDHTTLEQLAAGINGPNKGVKSRLSHPNMSNDGMGRHLGKVRNAKVENAGTEDSFVRVDQYFSRAAKSNPRGDMASHVMDLAEESPEDFGLSAQLRLDRELMDKLQKTESDGLAPIRLKGVRAVDVVDEPAASDGMFSIDNESLADLPFQATLLLDTYFSDATPDVIRSRVDSFLQTYIGDRDMSESTKTTDEQAAKVADLETKNADLQTKIEDLESKISEFSKSGEGSKEVVGDDSEAAKAELKRRAELSAFCQLANISEDNQKLLVNAGLSRQEAQEWLKASGKLSIDNPLISESDSSAEPPKKTEDETFGAEYDKFTDIYERQGVTRKDFIASRKADVN